MNWEKVYAIAWWAVASAAFLAPLFLGVRKRRS